MASKQQLNSQLGATARILNAEIKKQIVDVKAVDTGRMKNNTKVKITYDENKEMFSVTSINSTYYFKFVDEGTRFITPRKITDKTLKRDKVQKAFDKLFDVYMEYLVDREFELVKL
jgi:hypothetical protein